MKTPPYTLTQDSITVIWNGKSHTVRQGATNFKALRDAVLNDNVSAIEKNLTASKSIETWAKGLFKYANNRFTYNGTEMPESLNSRITEMATRGEDPTSFFKFWERLQQNPSFRSVQQLWPFLQHQGIPLTQDGCFLAYKSVRDDYKDVHSGLFDNKPGTTNEMPRNQISDDPRHACHEGFHVGALEYARGFGGGSNIVICEVRPEDVVCVPYDDSERKMRVCRYKVIGHHNGEHMPSTSIRTPKVSSKPKKNSSKQFGKFNKMNTKQLMDQSIGALRQYATQHLHIIGASKIPGGKVSLVTRIMKVRKK